MVDEEWLYDYFLEIEEDEGGFIWVWVGADKIALVTPMHIVLRHTLPIYYVEYLLRLPRPEKSCWN